MKDGHRVLIRTGRILTVGHMGVFNSWRSDFGDLSQGILLLQLGAPDFWKPPYKWRYR